MAQPDDLGPVSCSYISQRLRLHYLDWGNSGAPLLILLHGGRDHARSWDWVARALRRDWHVIAPDLRGHGDSAWSPDGAYTMPYFVYDLAQLIHQQAGAPATIVAHSLGGAIALHYAGVYPETVRKLVAIEGLGLAPAGVVERMNRPVDERWAEWVEERRDLSARQPRRYASIADALQRMRSENSHLSAEQAHHLTVHGIGRNEDGSFSWKFDNYIRSQTPVEVSDAELHALWSRIACPTLLCWGEDSWASNPAKDGRAGHFRDARVAAFANAGHWLHHDRFDAFMAELHGFL